MRNQFEQLGVDHKTTQIYQGTSCSTAESYNTKTTEYYCPVCKQSNIAFLPLPDFYLENSRRYGFKYWNDGEMTALQTYSCNRCGASDRERLYAFWLDQEISTNTLERGANFIHFAPERALSYVIRNSGLFNYTTADIMMEGVDYKVDLMDMPFADNSFNFFICSHVLEHVASDDKAITELYRVTRRGGGGILMAPIAMSLDHTIEDPNVVDESERWRLYGQNDHVRLYAHNDYVSKIQHHGFSVEQYDVTYFGAEVFTAMGLNKTSILYIVKK